MSRPLKFYRYDFDAIFELNIIGIAKKTISLQPSTIAPKYLTQTKLDGVQALRGIAAFLVVCFHITSFLPNNILTPLFIKGPIGVLLFFIISGFLMVYTTQNLQHTGIHDSKRFLIKRILRIVPLYYLATFAMILVHHKLPVYFSSKIGELVRTLLFIPQFSDSIGPVYGPPLLYVGWSLNYEMFFYVLFGLSLVFGRLRYGILFAVFLFLIFILPLTTTGTISIDIFFNYGFDFNILNFATNPIIIYFVIGMLLGLLLPKVRFCKLVQVVIILSGTALFILYYLDFIILINKPFSDLVFSTVLVIAVLFIDINPNIKIPRPLVFMGDISYPAYLIHPIVIIYLRNVFVKYNHASFTTTFSFFCMLLLVVIVTSYISHVVVEKRFTNFIKLKTIHDKQPEAK